MTTIRLAYPGDCQPRRRRGARRPPPRSGWPVWRPQRPRPALCAPAHLAHNRSLALRLRERLPYGAARDAVRLHEGRLGWDHPPGKYSPRAAVVCQGGVGGLSFAVSHEAPLPSNNLKARRQPALGGEALTSDLHRRFRQARPHRVPTCSPDGTRVTMSFQAHA